jgi:hypothetical protein
MAAVAGILEYSGGSKKVVLVDIFRLVSGERVGPRGEARARQKLHFNVLQQAEHSGCCPASPNVPSAYQIMELSLRDHCTNRTWYTEGKSSFLFAARMGYVRKPYGHDKQVPMANTATYSNKLSLYLIRCSDHCTNIVFLYRRTDLGRQADWNYRHHQQSQFCA